MAASIIFNHFPLAEHFKLILLLFSIWNCATIGMKYNVNTTYVPWPNGEGCKLERLLNWAKTEAARKNKTE